MVSLLSVIQQITGSTWAIFVDSAFLLLVGLVLAGLLHLVINEKNLARVTGRGKFSTVLKATLVGIPLPLCSCSVLPVAHQLRRSGLSRGGTAAFLIATPETGVDSILLTYALTDPLLTITRPVAAFASAITAGMLVEKAVSADPVPEILPNPVGCGCCEDATKVEPARGQSWPARIREGVRYTFVDLLGDMALYLVVGYLLAGLAEVLFESLQMDHIPDTLKNGWGAYLGAVLIGVPLYVCATSSTPLAAVLLGAGFSPGAILVFLMVGPATNAASLSVISKVLDKRAVIIYLASIVGVALIFGLLTDGAYRVLGLTADYRSSFENAEHGWLGYSAAAVLSVVIMLHIARKVTRRLR